MTVTRRELTLRIAGKLGMPPQDVARIVEALFETLGERLIRNERWEFRGFGVFEVRERASRLGRNPRTGEVVPVPPRRAVVFHPGKFMKQEIARWDKVLEKGDNDGRDVQQRIPHAAGRVLEMGDEKGNDILTEEASKVTEQPGLAVMAAPDEHHGTQEGHTA